jgi:hypothetical protein
MRVILLSCAAMLGLCGSMQAQIGVYGNFNYTRYTDNFANQTTSLEGVGLGAYDNFIHLGPIRAGVDLRFNQLGTTNYRYRSELGGVRVALKTPLLPIRPYAEALIGVGGTRYAGGLAAGISGDNYSRKFTYEFLGGLDYTIIPHVDLRVVELGYGRQTGVNGYPGNNPSSSLVTLGAGLVVRL